MRQPFVADDQTVLFAVCGDNKVVVLSALGDGVSPDLNESALEDCVPGGLPARRGFYVWEGRWIFYSETDDAPASSVWEGAIRLATVADFARFRFPLPLGSIT